MYADGQAVEILPRGRHKLSREEVEADQRKRILLGTTEAVGENGYAALTVTEITKRARVSRGVFYREFENREDAFLAACETASEAMLSHLYEVALSFRHWVDGVEGGTAALVGWLKDHPSVARMMFLELPAAGELGLRHRDRLLEGYVNLLAASGRRARTENPDRPEMPDWAPRMAAGAIIESIGAEFRRDRLAEPRELTARLVSLQLMLLGEPAPDRGPTPS